MAKTLLEILDELAPVVREAFLASIDDIKSVADMEALERLYRRGDVEGFIRALNLEPEFFEPFREALRSGYTRGGQELMAALPLSKAPGTRIVARFGVRNLRAENWIRNSSSKRVTDILDTTKEAIRETLKTGLSQGRGPRSVALDIVGRKDRVTGRRIGGQIGLTSKQSEHVRNAYRQLTSSDPTELRKYLKRSLRDERYDRTVIRAIKEGRPVPAADARRITAVYEDAYLRYRGEMIARTEMLQSLHAAQDEGLSQLVEKGKLKNEQIKRIWDASEDADTRDTHRQAEADSRANPARKGEPFTVGGYKMMYPGDASFGAPAEEIIACRCRVIIDLDFISELTRG